MSKNIAISDRVYAHLKREKGESESFSDVIEKHLQHERKIADVAGLHILDEETYRETRERFANLGRNTLERMRDESA